MKKEYKKPELDVLEIELESFIANSPGSEYVSPINDPSQPVTDEPADE